MFRVVSGTLKADSTVHNKTRDAPERLGHLMLLQGKTQTNVPEIKAGDLGAVAKLKDTLTNDTLGDKADPITFRADRRSRSRCSSYAIEPKSRGDEDKISTSMHRLEEEDPSIRYSRDPQTKELLLSGQGQLHIEVTVAKLKRRFGVDVNLKPPRIPYRETIKARDRGARPPQEADRRPRPVRRLQDQGRAAARAAPTSSSSTTSSAARSRGSSSRRSRRASRTRGTRGYLAGYPMVDFRVTVFDGSYHDVDSNELSFKLAGSLAFKDAMTRARPTILEPIMNVEVYAPSDFAGDLMGDLNGRRGRIARHGHARRDDDHQGAGADGRDAHLRAAPDVGDRRPRLVPHGVLALRRGAGAPADEDHRRGEGRAGGRRSRRSLSEADVLHEAGSGASELSAPLCPSRGDSPRQTSVDSENACGSALTMARPAAILLVGLDPDLGGRFEQRRRRPSAVVRAFHDQQCCPWVPLARLPAIRQRTLITVGSKGCPASRQQIRDDEKAPRDLSVSGACRLVDF